jgi:hypothetical protein
MPEVGRLQKVPLFEVWKHEALEFTPWLAQNIEVLGEALGIDLRVVEVEKTVGSFSLDILAEDETGDPVIIENQIYRTDHDHLGKVLTYLTNLNAKKAIWVSSDPRPEHIRAMAWLNESSPADTAFWLVRLEAYRIGDSPAAPLFSKIVEPSPESKEIGQKKEELAQRHVERLEFWTELLGKAKLRTNLHANLSPSKDNWVGTGIGTSGLGLSYVILLHEARVEIYIDRGAAEQNKAIFDRLYSQKGDIEADFGRSLSWERLDDRRACRIASILGVGGLRDQEKWPEIQEAMIDAMVRLNASVTARAKTAVVETAGAVPSDVQSGVVDEAPSLYGEMSAGA